MYNKIFINLKSDVSNHYAIPQGNWNKKNRSESITCKYTRGKKQCYIFLI